MNLRRLRIASQTVFTLFFIFMLFNAAWPLKEKMPYPLFLRLDPLISLTTMVSTRTFIGVGVTGLVVLVLAAVVGRYFCAWICPLGATIDFTDKVLFKRYRKVKNQKDTRFRKIKYFVLIGVLLGSVFGLNLIFLFDPIAIVTRLFTVAVIPPVYTIGNVGVGLLNGIFSLFDYDSDLAYFSFRTYHFAFALGTTALFLVITGLSVYQSRFWCRNICPVGALLGFVSRFGLFKRVTQKSCSQCRRCSAVCPMGAIPADDTCRTELAECTLCGNCTADCPDQHIAFMPGRPKNERLSTKIGVSRRQFLHSAGTGTLLALTAQTAVSKKLVNENVVRPPGSLPEKEFLNLCVRCGECMKACKTNCLQPSLLEAGWYGAMAPRGVFRIAGCEKTCNNCGQVCPTGAIRPLPLEEKQFVKMGTAVINRRRCVAWEQNRLCLLCDEICPYDAIEYRVVDEFTGPQKKPFVLEEKCVGCGMCEQKCPVVGHAAIYVVAEGQERKATGSYITPRKKKLREVQDHSHETEGIVDFGDGGAPAGFTAEPEKEESGGGGLPAGFTE